MDKTLIFLYSLTDSQRREIYAKQDSLKSDTGLRTLEHNMRDEERFGKYRVIRSTRGLL